MSGAVIVLQARMGSSRLPGKALAEIGPRSLVGHCLARLTSARAAPVVLATSADPGDDCLVEEATRFEVPVFRGSTADVLSRFVKVSESSGARYVVRATGDNPAVDMDAPARMLALIRSTGADYVREEGLPTGAAVEAMTAGALARASVLADEPADREHVTTLLYRDRSQFTVHATPAPRRLRRADLRLTVDTADDLGYLRRLWSSLGNPVAEPGLAEIIAAADRYARCASTRRSA
jgi:spore coat polysaccharide biosynthesis protein SpsF (cytidylyltransferase family)